MQSGQNWICKTIKIIKCTLCGSGNQNSQLLMYRRLLRKQISLFVLLYFSLSTLFWPPDDLCSDLIHYLYFPYIEEKVFFTEIKMKYPYKTLALDPPYTEDPLYWRFEGIEMLSRKLKNLSLNKANQEIQYVERTHRNRGKINFRWIFALDFFQERACLGCKGC